MSDFPPLNWTWSGESMSPRSRRDKAEADKQFVIGEVYRIAEEHDLSSASHKQQFAWLHDAWLNLPEDLADEYPTREHLRKAALIEAGFYTETIADAGSNAAALRMASLVKARDQFCVVIVRGPIIVVRDPMTQSVRGMGATMFNKSKTAIMEIIANMIGVSPAELEKNAGKAA